jgi:protein-S-isoprenylcysteine O-methyltransferase Ste14
MTGLAFLLLWLAWLAYWVASARRVKAIERRESFGSRLSYVVTLVLGGVLTGSRPIVAGALSHSLLSPSVATAVLGLVVTALGLGFSVWARRHLGTNWSGSVTIKREHDLVQTGPYAWVRHPIYTGLLLAFVGSAVARGNVQGLVGFAIITLGLIRKLRIEERWMRETFGEAYATYCARVPALVPRLFGKLD